MEIFFLVFIFFLIFYVFYIIGSLINYLLKNNIKNIADNVVIGFAGFVIISYHFYFILNLNLFYFLCLLIILIFYYNVKFFKIKNFPLKNISKYFFYSFLIFTIFNFPVLFSGEQFYVFRGNQWDSFNYLTSALLFNNYFYSEVLSEKVINLYKDFQSIEDIILYRPYINYFLSLFLNLKFLDIFYINYSFKIFLTIINYFAFVSFLDLFKKINKNIKLFLSLVLTFSFFSIYVFEIDALSQLASISLFLLSIKFTHLLFLSFSKRSHKDIFLLSLLNASLFIIYPEIFIFYCIILFCFFLDQIFFQKKKIILKNYIYFFFFFILLTISSYETNYNFLIIQISQALRSNIDWWGYYGAFLIGRENLVLDLNYINSLDIRISNKGILELLKLFFNDHNERGYNFILLNIIPSFFGLYHLGINKFVSLFSLLNVLLIFFLIIYLLSICVTNFKFLIKRKSKFFIILVFVITQIILFLIYNGNFWTVIKLYSYSFVFIFLFISINLRKQLINKAIIVLLISFPLYKYSSLDYGIGRYDSFPSIIKKTYKSSINWNLDRNKLKECNKAFTLETDYFIRTYILTKLIYYKKNHINFNDKNLIRDDNICEIVISDKQFTIKN